MNRVLFKVCDDALIVANTGTPFTPEGVISICYSHASEKGQHPPVDNYECCAKKLIEKIRERAANNYKNDPNLLGDHKGGEKAIGKDYSGRVVWELMQNADDAAKGGEDADLIGEKGLGFKSVLAITEEPEIHSGPFHFRFSSRETERFLDFLEDDDTDRRPLVFRIPHPHEPHRECEHLLNHDGDYATVIRLPFREGDDGARGEVVKQLRAIGEHNLLLCQGLDIIEVSVGDQETKTLEIDRQHASLESGVVDFSVKTDGQAGSWRRWLWTSEKAENEKRLSATVFLPYTGKQIVPCDTTHLLHVFFPTQEKIGAKALMHASFELQQNRERLAKAEEQPNECELLRAIEQLVSKILVDENVSLSVVAEIFEGVIEGGDSAEENDSVSKIKWRILDAIKETAFVPVIGDARVKPCEVKLWKHDLGSVVSANHDEIKRENLLMPKFNSPKSVQSMLKKFGAAEIDTGRHAELLRYCRHDTMDDCLRALNVANSIMQPNSNDEVIESLRQSPFWWTDQKQARAFDGGNGKALLHKKPDGWPVWLPVDSLSEEFRKRAFSDMDENEHAIAKWPLRGESQFRDEAMLPFLEEKADDDDFWRENRASVLRWVMAWRSKNPEQSILVLGESGDNPRERLAHLVRVPTDKGWLPAIRCYAGKSWGGPAAFDKHFNSVDGRGLVSPFDEWPTEAKARENSTEKWKNLLRFLGVSNELKMVAFDIMNPPSEIGRDIDGYKRLCLEKARHNSARRVFSGHSAFIEHFSLAGCSPAETYRMVKRVYDAKCLTLIEYRHQSGEGSSSNYSFVEFQLENSEWIPCKPALLHDKDRVKPGNAYMPKCGLGGLLPEIEQGVDDDEWHGESGIKKTLENLGVKNELPSHPQKWHEWMELLARRDEANDRDACRWSPKHSGRGDIAKAANDIFTKYGKEFKDGLSQSVPVPFLCQDKKGKFLAFAPDSDVFWVDESYLADPGVETAILQKEIKLFFLTLKQGEEFRLKELSKILDLRPDFGDIVPEKSKKLMAIYQERRDILNLIASCELPDICIRVRREMRLRSQKPEYSDIVPDVDSWYDPKEQTLDVSAAADQLEALAYGLAKIIEKDSGGDFCIMLAKKNQAECIETLRKRYRYPEEALEKLNKESVSPGKSSTPATTGGGVDSGEPEWPEPASDSGKPNTSQNDVERWGDTETCASGDSGGRHGGAKPSSHYSRGEAKRAPRIDSDTNNRSANQGGTGHINPEPGLKAEEWLRVELEKHGFDVVRTGTGSDYGVRSGGGSALVEVKHIDGDSGQIYLSQRQIKEAENCRDNSKNYFVAIVRGGEENREVFWFWNPLDDFASMKRSRLWERSSESVDMDAETEWDVAEPSTNISWKNPVYKVCVKIDADSMSGEGDIDSACEQLKSKLGSENLSLE